jgi:predicted PurR-regulated permease PerM
VDPLAGRIKPNRINLIELYVYNLLIVCVAVRTLYPPNDRCLLRHHLAAILYPARAFLRRLGHPDLFRVFMVLALSAVVLSQCHLNKWAREQIM